MSKRAGTVTVRLVLVDEGSYHHEEIEIPGASLEGYDRLIDCLRRSCRHWGRVTWEANSGKAC